MSSKNTIESEPSEKRKIILRVDQDDLPEIKNWEVGKKYNLEVTAKMISKSQGDPYGYNESGGKNKIEASFEITSIEEEDSDEDMKDLDADTKKRVKEIGSKRYG